VRLACDLDATCRLADGFREVGWHGRVRDISRGGIGLLTSHRFRPGTELAIDLRDRADAVVRTVRVRVVHSTATYADGNACWMQGCEFDAPLSEEELQALL
jgi:PilZ domain